MLRADARSSGWQGVILVAITYVYFLIFAQFAFLKRLASLGIAEGHLKAVMAAMAIGGISLSLLAPRLLRWPSPGLRLRAALTACAAAALLTVLPLGFSGSLAISLLIGAGLGLLTVTVATYLRVWLGNGNPLLKVGLGTGIGYLICNFPPLFRASPQVQAVTAAAICLAGVLVSLQHVAAPLEETVPTPHSAISFGRALTCFTALVWLDSAAFFIIQNTPALKAATWEGTLHLWSNGLLHLVAALAAAWCLRRRSLWFLLSLAYLALAIACLLLLTPGSILLASAFYPIGVSLYSVALVAYPSLLAAAATPAERGRKAGWIYAVAGWFGSAMGIGMGQNLGHVPPAFLLLSGSVIFVPELFRFLRLRKRELAVTLAALVAALCIERAINPAHSTDPQPSQIERGRQVYIAEGCINCHSQYVRPATSDVLMWGPVQGVEELRRQRPPLIGNRRLGPDLAEVGSRRSSLWLRAHFSDPAEVSHSSFMPSYSHLFRDHRGDDLIAYMQSLHADDTQEHRLSEKAWYPSPAATAQANAHAGARLFRANCATCHTPDGPTRQTWRTSFKRLPPDFATGPFLYLLDSDSPAQRRDRIAQIVKFGLPGTDMPGHEYFPENDIASISLWLTQYAVAPMQDQQTNINPGEK